MNPIGKEKILFFRRMRLLFYMKYIAGILVFDLIFMGFGILLWRVMSFITGFIYSSIQKHRKNNI